MSKSTSGPADATGVVSISRPDMRLQARIGGSARALFTPAGAVKATAATAGLTDAAIAEIGDALRRIETLARERPDDAASRIFAAAHDIRGVAGSFGRDRLGRLATCVCAYVEGRREAGALDPNALTMLVIAARQTMAADTDPLADELVEECEAMVARLST